MNNSTSTESELYTLKCVQHGHINSEKETTTYCTVCGSVLEIEYHISPENPHQILVPLKTRPEDPIRTNKTELKRLDKLSAQYDGNVWVKSEYQNPTGCFKDRGSYIEVLKARELGADAICLASTGNMAASVAAYASYFGIKCYVFVPEYTTEGKLAQAMVYNAKVIKVKGDYSTCEALCRKFAESGNYYLAGDYVFREEGQKSMSFEVIEQGGDDFDYVFVPVGCGTNFGAIWKGYREAFNQGLIKKLPKMVAVQPEGSSPVVKGIFKKEKIIETRVQTIAGAVAAADPVDFYKVLRGINESNGVAFTVSEEEILEALTEMAQKEGIFTEPASALGLAAFKKYRKEFGSAKCLFVLTGIGLKDTGVVVRHSLPSPVIGNDLKAIHKFINSGYLDIQASAWGKWQGSPFGNLKLEPEQAKIFNDYVDSFNKRGKILTEKELEVLQSMVFDEEPESDQLIQVLDYDVRMRKNGLVNATVSLGIKGKHIDAKAKGVGPLHAVITAVKSVTDTLIPIEVVDHNVEVLSPAASSLVVVTLRLSHKEKQFLVKSVSTDTIEAGLKAFVKGLALAGKA
ncbi:threonine synthase [bacterium]|nr:MAG: threonine synthase [bacterium]